MAASAAFQIDAFQQDAFEASAGAPSISSTRGRRIAYGPILDNAIRANDPMRFGRFQRSKPRALTPRFRASRLTSKAALAAVNSASYASQTAHNNHPTEKGFSPVIIIP